MLSPSDFIAQVSLWGMLHCKSEIVRAHPCSGDYTLIYHCNLNNDFIKKSGATSVSDDLLDSIRGLSSVVFPSISIIVLCVGVVAILSAVGVNVEVISVSSSAHRSDASRVSVSSSIFHSGSLLSKILVVVCLLSSFCVARALFLIGFPGVAEVFSNILPCYYCWSP